MHAKEAFYAVYKESLIEEAKKLDGRELINAYVASFSGPKWRIEVFYSELSRRLDFYASHQAIEKMDANVKGI